MTAAQHAIAEGDYALAAQRLIYARDAEPANPAVLRLMTLAFWQAGNLPAAARAVRDWARVEGERPTAHRFAARIYEDMGAIVQAAESAERETPARARATPPPGSGSGGCASGSMDRRRRPRRAGARAACSSPSVEGLLDLALVHHLAGRRRRRRSPSASRRRAWSPSRAPAWSRYAHALARTDRPADVPGGLRAGAGARTTTRRWPSCSARASGPHAPRAARGVTGAEALVAALEAAGVEVAFGLPGVHNLAAWEALAGSSVRLVGVRHEQAAVYAADGYARASGRVGVAIVTTGPGAANTLGALGEAWASRSPVVVIATDIPTDAAPARASSAGCCTSAPISRGCSRRWSRRSSVAAPGRRRRRAARAGRRGGRPRRPVYVEVPTDLLSRRPRSRAPSGTAVEVRPRAIDTGADLDAAASLLEQVRRPLVWAGGGAVAAGAGPAVAELAERLEAPIVTTHSARGLVGDHPLAVGLPPHLPRVGDLWDEADLVVAIGSDLDGVMTQNWAMPQPPRLVAINVDRADATKNYRADVVLAGDARTLTEALAARLPERMGGGELPSELSELRAAARAQLEEQFPVEVGFLEAFAAGVGEDAVVLCDMCVAGYWLGALHRVPAPRKLTYPLGWGTLGCAFPQSLGAALAGAGPVVSVSGDGGFLFACGELATARQESLPLTALIVDDGGYGMLRYDQARTGRRPSASISPRRTSSRSPGRSASPPSAWRARAPSSPTRWRATSPARSPPCWSPPRALEPPPTTSPRWYRRR